jgi:Terpene synthase family 2, C-terminal metal binding
MERFFVGLQHNALDDAIGAVPDIEDYILRRRETSICQPAFLLIEYAHGLDLPSKVYDDPIILNLTCLANDLISWSNASVRSLSETFPSLTYCSGHILLQRRSIPE